MAKTCLIPDCKLVDNFSSTFHFPKDLKLLDQWISKLPVLNLGNLNFKEALICEHHFNPKDLLEGFGFSKELVGNAVPEYFPVSEDIDSNSCRFCLRKIEGENFEIDELIVEHYKNLVQEELSAVSQQSRCCESCYSQIRNSSHFKSKIQENQRKFPNIFQKNQAPEYLDIKVELPDFDNDLDDNFEMDSYESDVNPTQKYSQKGSNKLEAAEKPKSKPSRKRFFPKKYCEICQQDFSNITRHMRRKHQDSFLYICDLDGESFFSKANLVNHIKAHQKKNRIFQCEICLKIFPGKKNLTNHVSRYHLRKNLIFCEVCGKEFVVKTAYTRHFNFNHTEERPFKCSFPDCTYSSVTNDILNRHVKNVHSTVMFGCSACEKEFKNNVALRKHFRACHAERNLICDFEGCGKAFSYDVDLKNHKKRHFNIRDYTCKICGASYFKSRVLSHHILSIHMDFKFKCEVPGCKGELKKKDSYKKHVLSCHKDLDENYLQKLLEKIESLRYPKVRNH